MNFFLYVTNGKAYQRKTEKIFVNEEIKFYRIGYGANPTKQRFFFANEEFFDVKLDHFIVN